MQQTQLYHVFDRLVQEERHMPQLPQQIQERARELVRAKDPS